MHPLADSHVHLDDQSFDADRLDVIARSRAAGVSTQIIPAVTAASWAPIAMLCTKHADLHPAYGLHPMFLAQHQPSQIDALQRWLTDHRAVAIGEIGLDYFVDGLDRQLQQNYFIRQLELAREFETPVIVHARRALEDVILNLRKIGGLRGVVHSFSGSEEQARQLWKLGFHIGIGGPVTYPRAQRLRRMVADMPIEYLLLETDAPDQPDANHRGMRNEPARLPEILQCIAELRQENPATIASITSSNTRRLFGLAQVTP
ncbi:MAG: TatD family hydrolase [Dyella sp.]